MGPRARPRTAGNAAIPTLTQPPCGRCHPPRRPKTLEDRQCPAQLLFVIGVDERPGGLELTATSQPLLCGSCRIAVHVHGPRGGRDRVWLTECAAFPQPVAEFAHEPGMMMLQRHVIRGGRFLHSTLAISCDPRGFGPGGTNRSDSLKRAGRVSQSTGLIQDPEYLRVATPRSQPAKCDLCHDPAYRGRRHKSQDFVCLDGYFVPTPLVHADQR